MNVSRATSAPTNGIAWRLMSAQLVSTTAMRMPSAPTPMAHSSAHARKASPATDAIVCLFVIRTVSMAASACHRTSVNVEAATKAPTVRKI